MYQYWTKCCTDVKLWFSQSTAQGNTTWIAVIGGIVGGVTSIWLQAFIPGACVFFATACGAGIYFCNWWLHIRLICLGGDRTVLGAIYNVDPQTPSYGFWNLGDYDTDYCFNVLLYGATPADQLPNNFVNQFTPPTSPLAWDPAAPTPWNSGPAMQPNNDWLNLFNEWPTLFPTIDWDQANLILPQQSMGSLGLGFTGQAVGTQLPLGPLQSITVNPPSVTVPNNSVVQFQAIGFDPTQTSQDITSSVTWASSQQQYATISGSGVATAASSGSGTTNITAYLNGVTGTATMTTTAGGAPVQTGVGPKEQMLLHCEIEGSGMYDFRTMLYWLLGIFTTAAVASAIPVFGWIISAFLMLLAFLILLFGGPALQDKLAGPPDANPKGGDGWGGFAYVDASAPGDMVDIVYVRGRWVFDSNHQPAGSNELHPLYWVTKVSQASQTDLDNGNWPSNIADTKVALDAAYVEILSPSTASIQSLPEFQFSFHPLIDGCQGSRSYAPPATPPAPK